MIINFNEIEDAFFYVSMEQMYMHSAVLCRETGEIYYTSEMGDSDELPDDVDDQDKYISIPHKNELDLGKSLVLDFTSEHMPDELEKVYGIFRRKGAYSRFKELLEAKGLLDTWYKYEESHQKEALREWCHENNIDIKY
jgi:hypothetical protein